MATEINHRFVQHTAGISSIVHLSLLCRLISAENHILRAMTDHSDPFANGPFATGGERGGGEFPNITQNHSDMLSVDLLSGASGDDAEAATAAAATNNNGGGELEATDPMTTEPGAPPSLDSMPKPSSFDNKSNVPPPIYQLNFDVEHIGKKKPQSKRQVTWTYGFPKQTEGGNMVPEEHETRLTWSTHSGKYSIEVDGQVVFESVAKGSVLEHKFIYNHTQGCLGDDSSEEEYIRMRIIACRKPPVRSSKNFRCYEFVIGGRVFRDLARYNQYGEEYHNEDSMEDVGFLSSILDIVDPSWRSAGMA